jgi:hypothetical protein
MAAPPVATPRAPLQTPLYDADTGTMNRAWILFFQALVKPGQEAIEAGGGGGTEAPPPAPTAVAFTVINGLADYTLSITWTPPADLGTTKMYAVEALFYVDAGGTSLDGVIPIGWPDADAVDHLAGPFSRQDTSRWVMVRVATINGSNVRSEWVEAAALQHITPRTVAAEAPPPAPLGVSFSITDLDTDYALSITWTPPAALGTTAMYQIEALFFTDAGAISSDGIVLLGYPPKTDTALLAGPFPRQLETSRWVIVHISTVNGSNVRSAWVQASALREILPISVSAEAPPPAPTGVAFTIDDQGGNYALSTTWTPPSPLGSTKMYQIEALFYTDAGGLDLDGIIPMGWPAPADVAHLGGPFPRQIDTSRWVKVRLATVNGSNVLSAWAYAPALQQITPSGAAGVPSGITLAVNDFGETYGLTTGWTPPSPLGSTKQYEVEAWFYTDASGGGAFFERSVVLGYGTVPDTQLVSGGDFPRQVNTSRWVKTRVRTLNSFNQPGTWSGYSALRQITPVTVGALPPIAAAGLPSGVAVSITDREGNYGITVSWAAPVPIGTTTAYEVEALVYTDAATTVFEQTLALGSTTDTALTSGYWPRPTDAPRYIKCRVRAWNSLNVPTIWVTAAAVYSIGQMAAPGAPTGVTVIVTDKEGNYGITTNWAAPSPYGTTTSYEVEALIYTDVGGTNLEATIALGGTWDTILVSGYWPRPTDFPRYLRARVRSVNNLGEPGASATSFAAASVIGMLAAPPSTNATTVSVGNTTRGGVQSFNFVITITPNPSLETTEGYLAEARYYSDAFATTPISDWIPLGWISPTQLVTNTDYWPRPTVATYAKIRIAAQNLNNIIGPWQESIILTISSGALDVRESQPTTFGPGIRPDSAGRPTTNLRSLLINGDFEQWDSVNSPVGWELDPATAPANISRESSIIYSGAYACRIAATAADNNVRQTFPVHPTLSIRINAYVRNSTNAACDCWVAFFTQAGAFVSITYASPNIPANSLWTPISMTVAVPATAAKAYIVPAGLTPSHTTGYCYVDQLTVTFGPPLQQADFSANYKPVGIGTTLPLTSDVYYPDGAHFMLTTTNRLYIKKGGAWLGLDGADIVAGTISAAVAYAGFIGAGQVNAGTFTGCSMSLNLNGMTTTINNGVDPLTGAYYNGLQTVHNSSGGYVSITFYQIQINGASTGNMARTTWGTGAGTSTINFLYRSGGTDYSKARLEAGGVTALTLFNPEQTATSLTRVQLIGYSTYGTANVIGGGIGGGYLVDGTQVVQARQSTVTSPTADVTSLKTAVDAIISRLKAHGLIA